MKQPQEMDGIEIKHPYIELGPGGHFIEVEASNSFFELGKVYRSKFNKFLVTGFGKEYKRTKYFFSDEGKRWEWSDELFPFKRVRVRLLEEGKATAKPS